MITQNLQTQLFSFGYLKWHENFEERDNKGAKLVKLLHRQYQGEAFAPLLGYAIRLPADTKDVALTDCW